MRCLQKNSDMRISSAIFCAVLGLCGTAHARAPSSLHNDAGALIPSMLQLTHGHGGGTGFGGPRHTSGKQSLGSHSRSSSRLKARIASARHFARQARLARSRRLDKLRWIAAHERKLGNCGKRGRGCSDPNSGGNSARISLPPPSRTPPPPRHRWPFWPHRPIGVVTEFPPPPTDLPPPPPGLGNSPPGNPGELALGGPSAPAANVAALLKNKRYRPGEVLFEVNIESGDDLKRSLGADYGGEVLEVGLIQLLGIRIWHLKVDPGQDLEPLLVRLFQDNRVRNPQPNYIYSAVQGAGQTRASERAGLDELQGPSSLNVRVSGAGVKIAIVDTCIDREHEELKGAVTLFFDAIRPGAEGCVPEDHGTAIAGLIGARAQLRGVAPAAALLSARALETTPDSPEPEGTSQTVLLSIDWAASQGAEVINLSFAGPRDPDVEREVAVAHKKGIVMVAAAGNGGPASAPLYPAAYPDAIAVTAVDAKRHLYDAANRGPYISVAAQGVDVLVARPHSIYDKDSGTSYAAATVSGVAALLVEKRPKATPDEIRRALQQTAIDISGHGRDDLFGFGLVNASAAESFVERNVLP